MHTYWTWAQAIAAGDWLSRGPQAGPFFYGPLYPYFLAVLFRVFGVSFDAVHGAQALIGLVMPVLVWWMARRLFDEVAG
ncbi:MAG: glycosyltransferase family 39 protein, partial [Candidatus Sumerlaeia bacterium]|nr:glycosyltransferase family 39 protein [Candidatus Sumerlaeia bacterium]